MRRHDDKISDFNDCRTTDVARNVFEYFDCSEISWVRVLPLTCQSFQMGLALIRNHMPGGFVTQSLNCLVFSDTHFLESKPRTLHSAFFY
jgi:hypothetical protein